MMQERFPFSKLWFFLIMIPVMAGEALPLVIVEDIDTTDFSTLYSIGYYMQRYTYPYPQEVVDFQAAPDFSVIGDDEPVYIIARGEPGKVAGLDSDKLLALMNDPAKKFTSYYQGTVYIFSDFSGAATGESGTSLVEEVARGLNQPIRIVGPVRQSITNRALRRENSEVVVLPERESIMGKIRSDLEKDMTPQAEIDAYIAGYKKIHQGEIPSVKALAETALGNARIRNFFSRWQSQGALYVSGDSKYFVESKKK